MKSMNGFDPVQQKQVRSNLAKLKPNEYLVSFTAGGLLAEETRSVISYLNDEAILNLPTEIKHPQYLHTNAESARQRVVQELKKRYRATGQLVFDVFKDAGLPQQNILIFYTCMKTYQILFDFMFQTVLEKWLSRNLTLDKLDVQHFLDIQSASHPEIDEWAETTREKIETVMIRMLNEVGLLQGGQLQSVDAPDHFWRSFVDFGDPWFLQAMLLNKEQRDRIQNG
jgi:hypothetical protein